MEVTGFGGRDEYTAGHIQLWLKVGPIASLARFHVVKMEVLYHVLLGRPWLHKHWLVPSTYHQCVKGRLNGRMICIAANPSPFEQAEAHLVETMFYNQWAPSGENSVSKPWGTFIPRWEDVRSDPELDLKGVSITEEEKEGSTCHKVRQYNAMCQGSRTWWQDCIQIMKVCRAHEWNTSGPQTRVAAQKPSVLCGSRKLRGRK